MNTGYHIFGVRHLSPGCSSHLLAFLEEKKPRAVLIEGPADATELLRGLASKGVRPPVALLAYTTELPIETVLYPFADYSPEYQAILWAVRRGADLRFIDLPSDVSLKLRQAPRNEEQAEREAGFHGFHNSLYEKLAASFHEDDYESYWERNFEHCAESGGLKDRLGLQSTALREAVAGREHCDAPYDYSYNLVREAHMRREIRPAIAGGLKPEEIVVVCGAYHVQGLSPDLEPMSDADLLSIPRATARITLMPYSYHRLSSRTGYGAGNKAPYYFETM